MVESGGFYSTFIDPVLAKMRTKVANEIAPKQRVIDIACGTGAQVFEIAKKADFVMGVDLSFSMIWKAEEIQERRNIKNTYFKVCDASHLHSLSENEFDVATMSLALHQFSPTLYEEILGEIKRVSKKIIIVDYAVPLPKNMVGYASRWAEFMAGREHHQNFQKFYEKGGLENILPENKISIEKSVSFARGAFQLVVGTANGKGA